MPTNDRRPILSLLLLVVTARSISSQPLTTPPTSAHFSPSFSLSAAIIFVTLVFAFFFLSFFSLYIRRCADNHLASSNAVAAAAAGIGAGAGGLRRRGLDPEVLESIPTMAYAAVKGIKAGKGPLECAICLSEFESDEETLRLLPGCCHVFHAECINPWLASHVTCPVCRSNLSDPAVLAADRCLLGEEAPNTVGVSSDEEEIDVESPDLDPISRRRSQSAVEGEDRYTLRLPDHVRVEIEEEARHRRAESLAGTVSSRRGNGQWSSLLKTVSGRRKREGGEAGEGSSKRIFPINGAPIDEHSGGGGGEISGSDNVIGSHPERHYAHTVTLTGFVFQGDVAASDWNPEIIQVSAALQSPRAPQ